MVIQEEEIRSEIKTALRLCGYNDRKPWRLFWDHEHDEAFALPGAETDFTWIMEHHELLATFKEFRQSFEVTRNEIRVIVRELAPRLKSRDRREQF
jgi:hypothetical protein